MTLITDEELGMMQRALAISAFSDDDAMRILRGYAIEKNAEIEKLKAEVSRLRAENDFIVKRLEDFEKEASKGAYY